MAKRQKKVFVKRPGALTEKANRAGMGVQEFARKHYSDPGLTGEQARFAVTSKKKFRHGGKRRSRSGGRS